MKLAFHGGARTVTGSKHILALNNGTNILLDCGMFQGLGTQTDDLNNDFGFNPKEISFVLLSHAHIDHSGLLPKLVKEGFAGKIYCTAATKDLAEILLYDSAEIQTYEADYINKKTTSLNAEPYEPLYTTADVDETLKHFEIIAYNEWTTIQEDVKVLFTDAGHLVGSAAISMIIHEDEKDTCITFSGDVGRYHSVLLQPPAQFPQADYLILESTYGDKHHDIAFSHVKNLNKWITKTCVEKGGKLIIPAFSVGRTQEVLYTLNQLELEKRLPDINIFVDSPLSSKATQVIKKYTENFNDRLQKVLQIDDDPFAFKGLKYIETVEESQQLMNYKEPCIIISASGTADAGRVKHHIRNCIQDANNTILLVGYCGAHSLGGILLNGAKQVDIFGEPCTVKAEIAQMNGMSAHGDYDDLCRFISCQDTEKVQTIFLVHGEYDVQQRFAAKLEIKGFKKVEAPSQHQQFELGKKEKLVAD